MAPFSELVILLISLGKMFFLNLICLAGFFSEDININNRRAFCALKTAKEVVAKLDFPLAFPPRIQNTVRHT